MSTAGLPAVDVLIVTALAEEQTAILEILEGSATGRYLGRDVSTATVNDLRIAVESLRGMGNVGAAFTAATLMAAWRASHLLLVGIAGGFGSAGVRPGDIVVPDQIVGYETARLQAGGRQSRSEVYRPDFDLLTAATSVKPSEWAPPIRAHRPAGASAPRVHVGTILSGEKIIADGAVMDDLLRHWPRAVGVEMESLGSALAAYRSGRRFLMIKGVSDLADEAKDDRWRGYAAEAAARFALAVLRRRPVSSAARPDDRTDLNVPGSTVLEICWRLVEDWRKLARYFEVPLHDMARFDTGDEPMNLWDWLAVRRRLHELPAALTFIGRKDLADTMIRVVGTGDPV